MNIAALSIRRPITVLIIVVACLMFGVISLQRVGLDLLPEINLPMAAVITIYPNADPQTVEQTVAVPIERALRSLRGVKDVTSMSMENLTVALVEFYWGTNLDSAQQQIRTNLDAIEYSLPEGVQAPIISLIDLSQLPVLTLTAGVPGDVGDVTEVVRDVVKPAIERVPGVAGVSISGGADRIISVEYDHQKLIDAGLSPLMLQQLIAMQNLSVPAGVVVDEGVRYQTRVGVGYETADDIAQLTIGMKRREESSGAGGLFGLSLLMPQFLTVGDVADVKETMQTAEGYSRVNGKPAVMLQVQKQSGQNTVTTSRRVREALDQLAVARPEIEITYVFDQAEVINMSLNSLADNIMLGGFLAVLVLWLFLRHVGSTLVVGLSIPLSVVFTLVLMYASELNLNLLTLGGLALGVGMLVDNSIVVLESIFRRQELGDGPVDAAVNGTKEVGMAILASTLTTVVVFVPVVFLESLVGQIFRELALTVIYSLLASLLVALTVLPLASTRIMRLNRSRSTSNAGRGAGLFRLSLGEVYERMLEGARRRRVAILGLCAVALVLAMVIVPTLGFEFFPPMDMARIDIQASLPPGTPVERTDEMARRLEARFIEIEGIEVVAAEVGSSGSGDYMSVIGGASSNTARISLGLVKDGPTKRDVEEILSDCRAVLAEVLADYEGSSFKTDASGWGSFGSSSSAIMGNVVTIEVRGNDYQAISEHALALMERFKQVPQFVEIASDAGSGQPLMLLDVNRTRALMGGLTVGQVGLGVRSAMLGTTVTYVERDGSLIPVVVKPKSEGVPSLESLLDMPITGSTSASGIPGMSGSAAQMGSNVSAAARTLGSSAATSLLAPATEVLVGRVASPMVVEGPVTLTRRNGVPYTLIKIGYEGMKLSEAVELAMDIAAEVPAPEGVTVARGGVSRVLDEALDDMAFVGLLAVVLVYMVMAIQYESLVYPFIVMFTMPLALIGAIGFLLLADQALGVTALIGLVVLAGVVVNNGIVMVDFINQLKAAGMPTTKAVTEASRARVRPILMTALTTILGLLPAAIGLGSGAEMQRPLAITVMGGLTVATFLTLFVIPLVYELIDSLMIKLGDRGYVK